MAPRFSRTWVLCVTIIATGVVSRGQEPSFEVASVRPNRSSELGMRINLPAARRFTATNVPLRDLIRFAYDVQEERLIGGPAWLRTDRFDIEARTDHDLPAWGPSGPPVELLRMLRTLLVQRFRLAVHPEARELPVYALVVAKGNAKSGPNIRRSTLDCDSAPTGPPTTPRDPAQPTCGMRIGPGQMVMGGTALSQFANVLSPFVRRVVIDRTGLAGTFDFRLSWTAEGIRGGGPPPPDAPPLPPVDVNGASIFAAIEEQLGLKLEPQQASLDVVVIDSVEHPSPD